MTQVKESTQAPPVVESKVGETEMFVDYGLLQESIRDPLVRNLVLNNTRASYKKHFGERNPDIEQQVEAAFAYLDQWDGTPEGMKSIVDQIHADLIPIDPNSDHQKDYSKYKKHFRASKEYDTISPHLEHSESILDAGCGGGHIDYQIGQNVSHNVKIYMTDITDSRIPKIKQLSNGNYQFRKMEVPDEIPFENNAVDTGILVSVLHHVGPASLEKFLGEVHRVIKPNGTLLIQEDMLGMPDEAYGELLGKENQSALREFNKLNEHQRRLVLSFTDFFSNEIGQGKKMPYYFDFKTLDQWQQLMEKVGFQLDVVMPIGFNPNKVTQNNQAWLKFTRV